MQDTYTGHLSEMCRRGCLPGAAVLRGPSAIMFAQLNHSPVQIATKPPLWDKRGSAEEKVHDEGVHMQAQQPGTFFEWSSWTIQFDPNENPIIRLLGPCVT